MRRTLLFGASISILCLCLALVAISPLGLELWTRTSSHNWTQLSDASQSYTAAGAILSTLAFAAVAAALLFQVRQTKVAQAQVVRMLHIELIELALEDHELRQAWGPTLDVPEDRRRQFMYMNLIFKYFQTGYTIGELTEKSIRRILFNRFKYELGRTFWQEGRAAFANDANSKRQHRFYEIAEEEYARAVTEVDRAGESREPHPQHAPARTLVSVGVIITAVLGVGWIFGIRRRCGKKGPRTH